MQQWWQFVLIRRAREGAGGTENPPEWICHQALSDHLQEEGEERKVEKVPPSLMRSRCEKGRRKKSLLFCVCKGKDFGITKVSIN